MFDAILSGNFTLSEIDEFISNTAALLLRIQAELKSNMSGSYTNSV